MRKSIAVFLLAAFVAIPASHLMATVIPPIGLAPGSQYELIFVTKDFRDGTSTKIADYNNFVAGEAALNPLLPSATWHAVASTTAINANANAPSGPLPVYNTNGELVTAAGVGIYTGSILQAVNADQNGNPARDSFAWTGSTAAGFADPTNFGKAMGQQNAIDGSGPTIGDESATSSDWIDFGFLSHIHDQRPLYALSSSITLPTPEPSAFVLLGSALLLIGAYRIRSQSR